MQHTGYNILLYILQGLVYLKRLFFWLLKLFFGLTNYLLDLFRQTIGFQLYKVGLILQKYFGKLKIPWDGRLIDFFGRRSTLQVVLFIVCVVVMIPHSKLYGRDTTTVAGRESLLFALVGPGEQDFQVEEVAVDVTALGQKTTQSWREGAITTASPGVSGAVATQGVQEIGGISAGGLALIKPTILPGSNLPTISDASGTISTGRTEIVVYEVQSDDVIGQIAEKFGISVETILWANNLSTRSLIRPGDKLKILPTSGLLHKVKSGDTVAKIAMVYDAKQEDIVKFNKLQKDGSDIVAGEELIVPNGEMPQPVSTYSAPRPSAFSQVVAPPPSVSAPAGSGYLWPTSARIITQYYGWLHTGLDIAGPIGTPLYASRSGRVVTSQCGYNGGYGCYIILDHGGGVQTLYGHASQLYVSVGESVTQGQTIAAMGSTGRSTGPHIHFEVRLNGSRQNPLKYIR